MTARAERLLKVAKEIVHIEARLGVLRCEFDRLLDGSEAAPAQPLPTIGHGRNTYAVRIMAIFSVATAPLSAPDVVAALGGDAPEDTVRAFFSKLLRRGLIERAEHGRYRRRESTGPEGANKTRGVTVPMADAGAELGDPKTWVSDDAEYERAVRSVAASHVHTESVKSGRIKSCGGEG